MFKLKLDIKSSKRGIAGRLSNFTERQFVFDGVLCRSIEGVLQSFKFPTVEEQRIVCYLYKGQAKRVGELRDWRSDQLLYWQGTTYRRDGDEYQDLLRRLYRAVYDQDERFRRDIRRSRKFRLEHSIGKDDPRETVLTREELLRLLGELAQIQ